MPPVHVLIVNLTQEEGAWKEKQHLIIPSFRPDLGTERLGDSVLEPERLSGKEWINVLKSCMTAPTPRHLFQSSCGSDSTSGVCW